MTTSPVQYPITNGPSKWDLSVALFDKSESDGRTVYLSANAPLAVIITMSVTSIQIEDGSRESWNIEGYAQRIIRGKGVHNSFLPPAPSRVFVYYRTDTRMGYIRFFEAHPGYLAPETVVDTTNPNLSKQDEWTAEALSARRWGVRGRVIRHHDGHGLCYEVQHEDKSIGYYDPSELHVVD